VHPPDYSPQPSKNPHTKISILQIHENPIYTKKIQIIGFLKDKSNHRSSTKPTKAHEPKLANFKSKKPQYKNHIIGFSKKKTKSANHGKRIGKD
jgi:hypothetical protein